MTRVLLVRLSALGDVVQSLGAVRALQRARPDLELCFLTQRPFAPLLQDVPGIAAVVAHDRGGGPGALLRTRRHLRALGCTIALDLQGNLKSGLCTWLTGARERIGAGARWRQEPWSRLFLTRQVPVPGPRHPALVAIAVVRALAPDAPALLPVLAATPAEIEAAAAQVRVRGIEPWAPFRVVVAGDPADPRSQRPAAIAAEVAASDMPALLLAGPDEAFAAPPAPIPMWRQERGQLRVLVGLGALVARCGGEVVGPDRGATHVLAAAGARTLVLFGAQDPALTAPPAARVLQHPAPPPCMPCRARVCRHRDGPVCMAFTSREGRELPAPHWLAADALG